MRVCGTERRNVRDGRHGQGGRRYGWFARAGLLESHIIGLAAGGRSRTRPGMVALRVLAPTLHLHARPGLLGGGDKGSRFCLTAAVRALLAARTLQLATRNPQHATRSPRALAARVEAGCTAPVPGCPAARSRRRRRRRRRRAPTAPQVGGAEFVAVGGTLAGVGQLAQWVAPAGTVQTCSARGRSCTIYSATPVAPSASAPMQTTPTPIAQARRRKRRAWPPTTGACYDETRRMHWMQTCKLDKSMFLFFLPIQNLTKLKPRAT